MVPEKDRQVNRSRSNSDVFLRELPTNERGWVGRHFQEVIRNGCADAAEVAARVAALWRWNAERTGSAEKAARWRAFAELLEQHEAAAVEYANRLLERSGPPPRLVHDASLLPRPGLPTTRPQLELLWALGFQGVITDRREASLLIGELLQKRGGGR